MWLFIFCLKHTIKFIKFHLHPIYIILIPNHLTKEGYIIWLTLNFMSHIDLSSQYPYLEKVK